MSLPVNCSERYWVARRDTTFAPGTPMAGRRRVVEKWNVRAVRARESLFPGSPASQPPPESQGAFSTTTMARLKSPAQLLPALPLNVADSTALRDQAARLRTQAQVSRSSYT